MNPKAFFNRSITIKRKYYWLGVILIGGLFANVVFLGHLFLSEIGTIDITVPTPKSMSCETLEEQVAQLSEAELYDLTHDIRGHLTAMYVDKLRPEIEVSMHRQAEATIIHEMAKYVGTHATQTLAENN